MIAEIEQALIDRIQSASNGGVLGYKLKKVDTWGGDNADSLHRLVKDFPAVWIIFAGDTPGRHTSKGQEWTARFNIVVGAQSLRNEKEARHGVSGHVGSYQMVKDIKALILNSTLSLDISAIKPGRTTPLINEKADRHMASVYGLEISTTYWTDQVGDTNSLNDFEKFHANWDIPPHGNVGVDDVIPDDENADATDHITLS